MAGTSADDWDTTFAVNLRAHFLVAQAALPRLEDGRRVVFIGSVAGLQPGSRLPAYDASKAGLIGLCRHVALEGRAPGRPGQRARPGPHRHAARALGVARPAVARRARRCRSAARAPRGRSRRPRCSCCPTTPSYITGQVLPVDGGLTLI